MTTTKHIEYTPEEIHEQINDILNSWANLDDIECTLEMITLRGEEGTINHYIYSTVHRIMTTGGDPDYFDDEEENEEQAPALIETEKIYTRK